MQEVGPATPSAARVLLMSIGAFDLKQGCGFVFDTANGPFFEFTLGRLVDGTYEVYRTHISEDLVAQYGHLLVLENGHEFCHTLRVTANLWAKKARGTLSDRVGCIADIAAVFGWDEVDDDPLVLSEDELLLRWHRKITEGPVTEADCLVSILARDLFMTLHSVNSLEYWRLFERHFPIVPSEAMSDPEHLWWNQHGQAVVSEVIKVLQAATPPGFCFEQRDGRWGFWRI